MTSSRQYRWIVVLLTVVFQAVSVGILIYSFALFVVPWLDTFSSPRRDIMLAIVALQLGTGAMSPLSGRALDKYPIRYLICCGSIVMAAGFVLISLATAWWQIIIVYTTLLPLGMVLAGPLAAQTLVAKWFSKRRGLAIGISAMGTSMGGFIFPQIISYLLEGFGWRSSLIILSLVTVVTVCPLTWYILKKEPNETTLPAAADLPAETFIEVPQWTSMKLLRSPTFWIPVIALIPLNAAFGGIQFNLGALMQDLGYQPGRAAMLISLISIAMIVGKLVFGGLADLVDHRRLYWVAASLMACALVTIQGTPSYAVMLGSSVLIGLATGGILPLMGVIYASRFGTASFGRVYGLVNMFLTIGAFGPLLAGWIYDLSSSYDDAFTLFLLLLIPAAVGMKWLKPPLSEDPS
ncbi:MAG: MFS transporter [Pseudomonadales bacterium]|jgi:MFS family permease|nr:MFS transporter [Pseudomonadales bacterium]MDP7597269.1 MFS transporter [Pseudomonadales bacterium]HJN50715.1 MFS transporter [Pseudomonadales bacterium]